MHNILEVVGSGLADLATMVGLLFERDEERELVGYNKTALD